MAVPVRSELAARLLQLKSRLTVGLQRSNEERRARLLAAQRGLPKPQGLLAVARQRLDDWSERLRQGLFVGLDRRQRRANHAGARLTSPAARIAHERSRLVGECRALDAAMRVYLRERNDRLRHVADLLGSYSYERILERGFALVQDRLGHVVTSSQALRPRQQVSLRFADGRAGATIDGDVPARRSPARTCDEQGKLL
jgi:exodeoxyribonuclease VII large subunit